MAVAAPVLPADAGDGTNDRGLLASGASAEELLDLYPYLEAEDIRVAVRYERCRTLNEKVWPAYAGVQIVSLSGSQACRT